MDFIFIFIFIQVSGLTVLYTFQPLLCFDVTLSFVVAALITVHIYSIIPGIETGSSDKLNVLVHAL